MSRMVRKTEGTSKEIEEAELLVVEVDKDSLVVEAEGKIIGVMMIFPVAEEVSVLFEKFFNINGYILM